MAYGSYEDLLDDPEIDVVYVSLPNSLHTEWTVRAAYAGKHVLCEKPLVVSMAEMDQIEQAALDTGVTIFEAFMYLHHPQTRRALELIQQGRLGKLQSINSWFNFYLPPSDASNVRLQTDLTGGALWDVGVYPNSLSIVMAGAGAPDRSVGAASDRRKRRRREHARAIALCQRCRRPNLMWLPDAIPRGRLFRR